MFVEQVFEFTWDVITAGQTGVLPASIIKNGEVVTEIVGSQAEPLVEVQGDTTDAANESDEVIINVRFGNNNVDTPLILLGDNEILSRFTHKSALLMLTADNNHASVDAKPKAKLTLRIPQ